MDSNVRSLETAPSCVADVFRRSCEAEGTHVSRSKRRKLRDRRVAVRKAFCNTMDFKSRVPFIPASIGQASGFEMVPPVLVPLLQKLEVIEGMFSQFISWTSSLQCQAETTTLNSNREQVDIVLQNLRADAEPFVPLLGETISEASCTSSLTRTLFADRYPNEGVLPDATPLRHSLPVSQVVEALVTPVTPSCTVSATYDETHFVWTPPSTGIPKIQKGDVE